MASGFKNVSAINAEKKSENQLYHVRGTSEVNTRAMQVPEVATSLNSGDVFVLQTAKTQFIWVGHGATQKEKDFAKHIAMRLKINRVQTDVSEGKEPEGFWSALGGKAEYPSTKELVEGARHPRLFQCSNASGRFVVEEIFNFTQDDLTPDDVFILDTYTEVWVWVGVESNAVEKKEAFQAALDYVKNAPDGRSQDTPVMRVDCGHEPPLFSCHFLGWDPEHFNNDPYLSKLMALTGYEGARRVTGLEQASDYLDPMKNKFPYAELKAKTAKGIDPSCREFYLNDDEFNKLFGMNKEKYMNVAEWKKKNLKQKLDLF
jgi:hypothetical protein